MSGEEASKITVTRPEAGSAAQVLTEPGRVYALSFDHLTASFEPSDQDMRLSFPDGAVLTLQGFCTATAENDITLELEDGTQFSGAELVEALSVSLQDFHTDNPLPEAGDPSGGPPAAPSAAENDAEAALQAANAGLAVGDDDGLVHLPPPHFPPVDDFGAMLEPDAPGLAPLCGLACELSHDHTLFMPALSGAPDAAGYFITPHTGQSPLTEPVAPISPSRDEAHPPSSSLLFPLRAESEVLLLEDLLDVSQPDLLPGALLASFEAIFCSGDLTGPDPFDSGREGAVAGMDYAQVSSGVADSMDDDLDRLLALMHSNFL